MKHALILLTLLTIPLGQAFADKEDKGFATQYKTDYRTWNRTFSGHYAHSEYDFADSCRYRTCYHGYSYSDTVYVRETVIRRGHYSGYTRVTVYRSSGYEDRYVTYYTHRGRVVRRNFHYRHPHIHHHYVHHRYDHVHYSELDEFSQAIIAGAWFIDLGANVLASCHPDNQSCQNLGLASSVSGIAISISASINEQKKSELQKEIENEEEDKREETLNTSLDEDFSSEDE